MPRGVPKIGSSASELAEAPKAEVVGTIAPPTPKISAWTEPDGTQVQLEEGPPPWEVVGEWAWNRTDARQFVNVPDEWELRWLNPQILNKYGARGWMPVHPSDSRVEVKNRAMVSPENYIRKGGRDGDILHYMPKHWYASKRRIQAERTERLTRSSRERIERTKEEFRRNSVGRYVSIDSATIPTDTTADGRTMKD